MLDVFISENRELIIARARARVSSRIAPKPGDIELTNGVPVFLDQLGNALRIARTGGTVNHVAIGKSATLHGSDLLRMGLTIAQVVHDYGDVCQSITETAVSHEAPITGDEFRTLNLCLDDAIAEAVTEFSKQRERSITQKGTERLGILSHEMRNLLNTAVLAYQSIQSGQVAPGGSTALVLGRSLIGLRNLVDQSLADVRLDAGIQHLESVSVAEFVEDVEIGALLQAQARNVHLAVTSVDKSVTIEADRQSLAAAVSNLLQNAFKFTPKGGHVSLTTRATTDRVSFAIEDECGGLPPGKTEELFRPFEQRGADHSGAGLGLTISFRAAKANGGELDVRDVPGKGCIFSISVPRRQDRSNGAHRR